MPYASRRRHEAGKLIQLGLPIVIAQLAQTSMGFVDTVMAGRVAPQDLAAVALGSSLWIPLFLALEGLLMATTPLVAHEVGAGRLKATAAVFFQACWIALLCGLLGAFALNNVGWILQQLQVSPPLAIKTQAYLGVVAWGFPAILLYQVIRSFSEGFGRTRPVMKIAVLGLLCNIPLNYVLVFGKLGLPALGGEGCGWATALVMWIMLGAGLIYLRNATTFAPCGFRTQWQYPRGVEALRFLRLGLPIGIALLIEASMFSVIALLLADQGEIIVAAHQVTLSFSGLTFMLPLSIAMAITIRVSQQLGAGKRADARYSAATGMMLALACALFSATLMFLAGDAIAELYTPQRQITRLAGELLAIAAFFQVSDAIQVASAGALRGYKDTAIPLGMVFIAYWIIGLPAGYLLAKTDMIVPTMGPHGFWLGLTAGLTVGAILLLSRLLIMSRPSACRSDT